MHTEYVDAITFQIFTYLCDNYGSITDIDIENNDEEMHSPYNSALPLETLFH